ncbi:MAG: sugar transferase [Cyanothece sp. SIO1E1]|nr:sugar transferase [Cyanothece sp. SIO1E1]
MVTSRILLTTSKLSVLQIDSTEVENQRVGSLPACGLKWRQGRLWIQRLKPGEETHLPSLQNEQWFTDCLKRSPVQFVCLDVALGAAGLRRWADACEQASKQVFLRLPANSKLSDQQTLLGDRLRQTLNPIAAALLLLVLSPMLIGLILLLRIDAPGPLFFRQWRVGKRGQLFRSLKFRTQDWHRHDDQPRLTPLRGWILRSGLDRLPQLVNVLRGEISLVGPAAKGLYHVARWNRAHQWQLRQQPGMIEL